MAIGDMPVTDRHRKAFLVLRLAASFLAGQGLVQALTLVVGLLLVRVLPVDQYALYTIAGSLLAVVSVGSNLGLSHAIVTLGTARREDRAYVGALLQTARQFSTHLFPLSVLAVLALSVWMFRGLDRIIVNQFTCVVLVVAIGYLQIDTSLDRAVLNMHHDSAAILRVGIAEALVRLMLVAACLVWPMAIAALSANLAGAAAARYVARLRTAPLLELAAVANDCHRQELKSFVLPIVPVVLYALLQGQIAIFVLSAHANTQAIAEVGALSRLGQLFTVLIMLNPFLVQPVFARITSHRDFLVKLTLVLAALAVLTVAALGSAFVVPKLWLLLLGANYTGLSPELPLAIGTALATVVGGTLYTVVIARGDTRGQSLSILPCLGGQLLFIALHGMHTTWTTSDALMLGLIPALAYAFCQSALLLRLLHAWPSVSMTPAT